MKSILVGYDGFDRGEPIPALAIDLAEEHGAQLHVIHVVPAPPRRAWRWIKDDVADKLHLDFAEERRKYLENLVEPARNRGVPVHVQIRSGHPHLEILRHALSIDVDLLVVVDEPTKRDGRRGFGTVTKKLFRKCPCPVLAKRSNERLKHSRILAAVDVGPRAAKEEPPNRLIVEMAGSLARRADSHLYLFHAWSLWNEHFLRNRANLTEAIINRELAEEKNDRREKLDRLIATSRLDDIDVEVELVKGDPRESMLNVVRKRDIDLVVMGTVSRTGILGLVIGNTAEKVLNELECSVLALKPKDFVSPVVG